MSKNILCVIPVTQQQKIMLKQAAPEADFIYSSVEIVSKKQIKDADIILGNVPPAMIEQSEKLQWIHLNSAGSDLYSKENVLGKHTLLTTSSGAYGKAVSEHIFALLMALEKKLHLYRDMQNQHLWCDKGEVGSITDSVVLIVGAGDIGQHFAKLVYAMGAYVIGIKRTSTPCPEYMHELHTIHKMKELLPKADIVVSFLPSTSTTRGMFNCSLFSYMKEGSFFLNGGRGDTVCTEDLCDALESGHLAGAGLDVTDPEPLSKEHRLWSIPNAFITPHISGYYHLPETQRNVVHITIENLRRFTSGKELKNLVKH